MSITFSTLPNEIVTPGTPLFILVSDPIDTSFAEHQVKVFRGNALVKVPINVNSRLIEISTNDFSTGVYKINVGRLIDSEGNQINSHAITTMIRIRPVAVILSREERIEHAVRLAVGEFTTSRLRPGEAPPNGSVSVEFFKIVNRRTHVLRHVAFDGVGQPVDGDKILKAVGKRRQNKFGRIQERLWHQLRECGDEELVPVVIWPRMDHDYCDYDKSNVSACHDRSRSAFRRSKGRLMDVLDLLGAGRVTRDFNTPPISTSLRREQIRRLAEDEDVALVFPTPPEPELASWSIAAPGTSLDESLVISRADRAHILGINGAGVNVAVYEIGPSDLTNLDFADRYSHNPPVQSDPNTLHHSQMTSAIVKNIEPNKPNGFAPACSLYSANNYTDDALNWAIRTQSCTVISKSFKSTRSAFSAVQESSDWLYDWYATTPPFPTIVTCAGNQDAHTPPWTDYVSAKYYNGLIVGSHDQSATNMSPFSDFRNPGWPDPNAAPTPPPNDRELPDICAMGEYVTVLGLTDSGTSFSTPAVAGTVALVQSVDTRLQHSPEACRAIIYAAAGGRHIHPGNGTWWDNVVTKTDIKDGAGVLDADAAVQIAWSYIGSPDTNPLSGAFTERAGWGYGLCTPAHFAQSPAKHSSFVYRVRVPTTAMGLPLSAQPTFRAALAWNAKVSFSDAAGTQLAQVPSTLGVNLGLVVLEDVTGTTVASSSSFDNSYEIADFLPTPGMTYRIVLRLDGGEGSTWYGLSWCIFYAGQIML